jgi:hypothetical protein
MLSLIVGVAAVIVVASIAFLYSASGVQRSEFWKWATLGVSFATLAAVIVYAYYAKGQLEAMIKTNQQTRDALVITERAYVNFGFSNGKFMRLFPLEVGKPIMVGVHLHNSGRLPATRVILNYGISRPFGPGTQTRQIVPHHITSCDPAKDDLSSHPDWTESIISANATETRYLLVPTDKLTADEITTVRAQRSEIAVLGTLEYCDGFGHIRCSMFCASYKDDVRRDFVPCLRGVTDSCYPGFAPPGYSPPEYQQRDKAGSRQPQ